MSFRNIALAKYIIKGKSKYYIHSPFVYEFCEQVLFDKKHYYAYDEIEDLRSSLLRSDKEIEFKEFGAGSSMDKSNTRKLSSLIKNVSSKKKYGRLLFRIVNYFKPENILELGTSLGIGTLYLAKARRASSVVTIEGDPSCVHVAKMNFNDLKANNIFLINAVFDDVLDEVLDKMDKVEMAFIDGNHQGKFLLKYFNSIKERRTTKTVIIIDDINWSRDMNDAWQEIKKDKDVTMTMDIFQFGIVFFKKGKIKEDFMLYF